MACVALRRHACGRTTFPSHAPRLPHTRRVAEPLTFTLTAEYIELGQLLKATNVVSSGGEVKAYLAEHEITINGVVDNRRGRKLRAGDTVMIEDYLIISVS